MRRAGAALSTLLLLLGSAAASPAAAATVRVEVKGIAFAPAKAAARVGDTIEWTNKDFVVHSATARRGGWDVNLPPGKSGRTVLIKAGKVAYYCRYHPNMTGEIDVAPK